LQKKQDLAVLQTNGSGVLSFATPSGGTNTPAFFALKDNIQSLTNATTTKIDFNVEDFDTDNNFASSRFTPTTSGKYFIGTMVRWNYDVDTDIANTSIYKNGAVAIEGSFTNLRYNNWFVGGIVTLNGSSDYVEIFCTQISGSTRDVRDDEGYFFGYKLIGV
jgi:hypothetical protein